MVGPCGAEDAAAGGALGAAVGTDGVTAGAGGDGSRGEPAGCGVSGRRGADEGEPEGAGVGGLLAEVGAVAAGGVVSETVGAIDGSAEGIGAAVWVAVAAVALAATPGNLVSCRLLSSSNMTTIATGVRITVMSVATIALRDHRR